MKSQNKTTVFISCLHGFISNVTTFVGCIFKIFYNLCSCVKFMSLEGISWLFQLCTVLNYWRRRHEVRCLLCERVGGNINLSLVGGGWEKPTDEWASWESPEPFSGIKVEATTNQLLSVKCKFSQSSALKPVSAAFEDAVVVISWEILCGWCKNR